MLGGSVRVVARETGRTLTNANGDGIEHFGYVDGRSQPLFIEEDLEHERETTDGVDNWNPLVPLREVLVRGSGRRAAGRELRELPRLPQARAERARVQEAGGADRSASSA